MVYVELDFKVIYIMEYCYGGYIINIFLFDFFREENFFVYILFDELLFYNYGGFVWLVVFYFYVWKSVKWINGLEFLDNEELGFWECNGYYKCGEFWLEECYGFI